MLSRTDVRIFIINDDASLLKGSRLCLSTSSMSGSAPLSGGNHLSDLVHSDDQSSDDIGLLLSRRTVLVPTLQEAMGCDDIVLVQARHVSRCGGWPGTVDV